MAQQFRALAVLPEDLNWASCTHIGQLTTPVPGYSTLHFQKHIHMWQTLM